MFSKEYAFIASEITELKKILHDIPQENVIERLGFEHRLEKAQNELQNLKLVVPSEKIVLTFKGKPVRGTHGIMAKFAAKATGAFTEVFAMIAANAKGLLSKSGPIPGRDGNELLITGTAIGSFGFEFELPPPNVEQCRLPLEDCNEDIAFNPVQKMELIFRQLLSGNDDELSESIEDMDQRAINKVYDFLDVLKGEQAFFTMDFGENQIRYTSDDDVAKAYSRLKADNIVTYQESFEGKFQGILPTSRTFEFKLQNETVISGKIGSAITDTNEFSAEYLNTPLRVTLEVRQVGHGKPRYSLVSPNEIIKRDSL